MDEALVVGKTVRFKSEVNVPPRAGTAAYQQSTKKGKKGIVVQNARRAILATLPDDVSFGAGVVSLVPDDLAPQPLKLPGRSRDFLIAPMFNIQNADVEECEANASDVMPLLPFEQEGLDHDKEEKQNATHSEKLGAVVKKYKSFGDQLLRIHDYTCATSYYEAALSFVSSNFDVVGGSLVVRKSGHAVIAEVDCIDSHHVEEKTTYDVTYLESAKFSPADEATITKKDILLSLWEEDGERLQIRLLLNLSRCLLRLAEIDKSDPIKTLHSSKIRSRREKYIQSAVLGCSIAIILCEYYHNIGEGSESEVSPSLFSLLEKSRLVRSKAFCALGKLSNAMVDAKRVVAKNATNREAQDVINEIRALEAHKKLLDKRLAKDVSKWVHSATNSGRGVEVMDMMDKETSVSDCASMESDKKPLRGSRHKRDRPESKVQKDEKQENDVADKIFWRRLASIGSNLDIEILSVLAFVIMMWMVYTGCEN